MRVTYNIPEYLIEAYMGVHNISRGVAKDRIELDIPQTHLETYLQWQGIIGYTANIQELALGTWYIK